MRKMSGAVISWVILLAVLFVSVVLYIVLMLNVLDRLSIEQDDLRRIARKWLNIEISLAGQAQADSNSGSSSYRAALADFQEQLTTYLELPWFVAMQRAHPDLRLRSQALRQAVSDLAADLDLPPPQKQGLRARTGSIEGALESLLGWMGAYGAAQRSAFRLLLIILVVFTVLSALILLGVGKVVRMQETRFLAAIDSMSDAVILTDSSNLVFHANPAARRLFGTNGAGLEEKPLPETLAGSRAGDGELLLTDAAGHRRPVSLKVEPVVRHSGGSSGSVYLVRDLTEWKKLAASIASTFVSLQVHDADRVVARALSEAATLCVAERCSLLMPLVSKVIRVTEGTGGFSKRLEQRILEAVRQGEPVYFDGASVWEEDAEQLAAESLAWVGAVPLRLGGVVVGALAVGSSLPGAPWGERDTAMVELLADLIVELFTKKWAILEVSRLGSEYEDLIENANVPIWGVDTDRRINEWNQAMAKLTGIEKRNALGSRAETLVPPVDSSAAMECCVTDVLRGEKVSEKELTLRAGVRCSFTLLVSASPRLDSAGRVIGGLFIGQDISARVAGERRIEEQARALVEAQETERLRISRDLHDNAAQDLSAARIACETLFDEPARDGAEVRGRVTKLSETIASALQSIRAIVYDLRPPAIEQFGLFGALHRLCESFSTTDSLMVTFQSAGTDGICLSPGQAVNIYRIVQESLANVRRHASARNVTVNLVRSYPDLILRITDDGRGFDVDRTLSEAAGRKEMGLLGIRERVTILGGTLAVNSNAGKGTQLRITVPLPGSEKPYATA